MTERTIDWTPRRLRCERLEEPLGIGASVPMLSWELPDQAALDRPLAHRIAVATTAEAVVGRGGAEPDVWDSGWLEDPAVTVATSYGGPPLDSRRRLWWSVRLRTASGGQTDWSAPTWFEIGLLSRQDWIARWIARQSLADGVGSRAPYLLRRRLTLDSAPPRARLYASALGAYEIWVNGTRVGEGVMRPGWTDHRSRVQYQVVDITGSLTAGENVIGAILAPGWYAGRIGSRVGPDSGGPVALAQLLVQVELELSDGPVVIGSDERWEWRASPISRSDLYDGDDVDLRMASPDWSTPKDVASWEPVELATGTAGAVVAERCEPLRAIAVTPASVIWRADGSALVDSGRNNTGYLRLGVDAERGRRVEVRYAEMLDPAGNLYRDNLRAARCSDSFVCAGGGPEELAPSFSYRGWRYAEVTGLASSASLVSAESVTLGTGLRRTGWFSCSEPLLEQLYEMMICSLQANYVEVPTDCPQRDERAGWMADALLFAPVAAYTYDVAPFMAKWFDDILDARTPDGGFADVAPRTISSWPGRSFEAGSPAWADAGVLLPWLMYERYGDRAVLESMYPAMRTWLELVHGANPDGIWRHGRGNDYGDWVPAGPDTSHDLFSTCWLFRSSAVGAQVAALLGDERTASWLASRAAAVRSAFLEHYVDGQTGRLIDKEPTGSLLSARRFAPRLAGETQTGYVLSLAFGLLEGRLAQQAGEHLASLVVGAGRRLETGFCGSALLLSALDAAGYAGLAYDLLLRREPPSLGFMASMGATSVWERWDGLDLDGWPACPTMNSLNHYAMSSMLSWLIEGVCGLRPDPGVPALGSIRFAPALTRRLRQAGFDLDAPTGRLGLHWEWLGDDRVVASVHLPAGMTCRVARSVAVDDVAAGAFSSEAPEPDSQSMAGERVLEGGDHEVVWRVA